jgi:tetraacyldisaccharide-1-P 4'-kinase
LLWHVADGRQASLAELIGRDVRALCAIGNPESFHWTIESLGAIVKEKIVCRDHARLSPSLVSRQLLTVCTEKDAMRFKKPPENLYALGIELQEFEV